MPRTLTEEEYKNWLRNNNVPKELSVSQYVRTVKKYVFANEEAPWEVSDDMLDNDELFVQNIIDEHPDLDKNMKAHLRKFKSYLNEKNPNIAPPEPNPDDGFDADENEEEESLETIDNISLNTILYGPPGTGKTYNTMAYAVAICDEKNLDVVKKEMAENFDAVKARYDALLAEERIAFVTFHQSYGYEEFIEGIKPKLDAAGDIQYENAKGVFRRFCEGSDLDNQKAEAFDDAWNSLCKKLDSAGDAGLAIPYIGDANQTFLIEWNVSRSGLKAKDAHRFFNKAQLFNIYMGLPGVKKKGHDNYRKAIVTYMKQNCGLVDYTEQQTEVDASAKKVFIIDEINRGNISKIFGELITLIEESKRIGNDEGMTLELPYSKEEFGVPNNVYILGTMNTADRSIAMMDTALRRRFNFVEMMPNSKVLEGVCVCGIDVEKMLNAINERIEVLYDREHTIGHAFFTPLLKIENRDLETLQAIFRNKVIPLLQEYFYDDYEKILAILGSAFVEKMSVANVKFADEITLDNLPESVYKIKYPSNAPAYIAIYGGEVPARVERIANNFNTEEDADLEEDPESEYEEDDLDDSESEYEDGDLDDSESEYEDGDLDESELKSDESNSDA